MQLATNTIIETIAVRMLSGQWHLMNIRFSQDKNNSFRTIYPMTIESETMKLEFYKNTNSNRTMYREVPFE